MALIAKKPPASRTTRATPIPPRSLGLTLKALFIVTSHPSWSQSVTGVWRGGSGAAARIAVDPESAALRAVERPECDAGKDGHDHHPGHCSGQGAAAPVRRGGIGEGQERAGGHGFENGREVVGPSHRLPLPGPG